MSFTNPTYLWGFLSVLIPLAIHLWSRKEGSVITVGSIQLLKASASRQSSKVSINEIALLFLRCLLLMLLTLALAGPQFEKDRYEKKALTYLVERSLLNNRIVSGLIDSMGINSEMRLLEDEFPLFELDKNYGVDGVPDYWQLSTRFNTIHSDSLVVFTRAYLSGIKGKRPESGTNVQWIIVGEDEAETGIVNAYQSESTVMVLTATGDPLHLFYYLTRSDSLENLETKEANGNTFLKYASSNDWIALENPAPKRVALVYDHNFRNDAKYAASVLSAIGQYLNRNIDVEMIERKEYTFKNADLIFWLSDLSKPELKANITASWITFKDDRLAMNLIEKGEQAGQYYLTQRLNSTNIFDQHLGEQILPLLELYKGADQTLVDKRAVDVNTLSPKYGETLLKQKREHKTDVNYWPWLLLLGAFIVERGLSWHRRP